MYERIFALDACFKLSLKSGAKKKLDNKPELAPGGGVFVDNTSYHAILEKNKKVLDVSILVLHAGLQQLTRQ